LTEALANLLAATSLLVNDAVDAGLPRSRSTAAALVTLAHQPGLSIDALRTVLGLTHSGAVRLVDRLEEDGLVKRARGGRSVAVTLTHRGRQAVSAVERARLARVAELLEPLTAAEQRQLEKALREILAARTEGLDDLYRICRLCSFPACESDGRACPVAEAVRTRALR
jgi:DNA-binding MarR family transcriptional regulator